MSSWVSHSFCSYFQKTMAPISSSGCSLLPRLPRAVPLCMAPGLPQQLRFSRRGAPFAVITPSPPPRLQETVTRLGQHAGARLCFLKGWQAPSLWKVLCLPPAPRKWGAPSFSRAASSSIRAEPKSPRGPERPVTLACPDVSFPTGGPGSFPRCSDLWDPGFSFESQTRSCR